MKPGTRVTVQGRAGVVKALRPGNSVDVQFDGEAFTTRHDSTHLQPLRSNPGPRGGLTARERDSLPNSVFALPGRRFPINDANHGRIALQYILAGRVAEGDVNTVVQAVLQRWGRNREVMAFYNKHKAKLTRQNVERIHGRRMAANPAGEVYDPAKEQLRARTQGIYETEVRRFLGLPYNTAFKDARGQRLDDSLDAETKRNLSHKAHAIATVVEQRDGNLIPGTRTPTAKGIQRSAARLLDPSQRKHAEENREDYERTLAGARKGSYFRVVTEVIDGQKRHFVQPRPPAGLVQIPAYRLSADKAQEDADRAEAAFRKSPQSVKGRANPYYYRSTKSGVKSLDIEDEPEEGTIGEGIEVGRETYQSLADRLGVPVNILMWYGTVTLQADEDYGTDDAGKRVVIPAYTKTEYLVPTRREGSKIPRPGPRDVIPAYMRGGVVSKAALVKAFEAPLRDKEGKWSSSSGTARFETPEERDQAKAERQQTLHEQDERDAKTLRTAAEAAAAAFEARGEKLRKIAEQKSKAKSAAEEAEAAFGPPDKSEASLLLIAKYKAAEREYEAAKEAVKAYDEEVERRKEEKPKTASPVLLPSRAWSSLYKRGLKADVDPYSMRETPPPTEEMLESMRAKAAEAAAAEERKAEEKRKKLPAPPRTVDADIVASVVAQLAPGYAVMLYQRPVASVYVPGKNTVLTSYEVHSFLARNAESSRPALPNIRVGSPESILAYVRRVIENPNNAPNVKQAFAETFETVVKKLEDEIRRRKGEKTLRLGAAESRAKTPREQAEAMIEHLQSSVSAPVPSVDRSLVVTPQQYTMLLANEQKKLIEVYLKEHKVKQAPQLALRKIAVAAEKALDEELKKRKLARSDVDALKTVLEHQLQTDKTRLLERYALPPIETVKTRLLLSTSKAPKTEEEKAKAKKAKALAARELAFDVKKAGAPDTDILRPFWDVEQHYDELTKKDSVRYVLFVPSTIAYMSKVKRVLGRVEVENASMFVRGEKGVTSEDYARAETEAEKQLARLREAYDTGNFIEESEAKSALSRLAQDKQVDRANKSLMSQAVGREPARRISAAQRVALFVLPAQAPEGPPSKYDYAPEVQQTVTDAEGWMEDVEFVRQRQREQVRARARNERVSGPLSGYSKFYTTSPLLAYYTILLWNSPELFTGFDIGLPAPHRVGQKTYWKNISIGPVTSPQNVFNSPLYAYYAALAELMLLHGDLLLALLSGDAERAAENIIDIEGTTDPSNNVQMGLGDAAQKLGYRFQPISRRPVAEREAEVKLLKAQIKRDEDRLKLGGMTQDEIKKIQSTIDSLQSLLPSAKALELDFEKTPLAALLRSGDRGGQELVADAHRRVAAKVGQKLIKKNPQRSFR